MNRLSRELQFGDYLRILGKNRWIILGCVLSFIGPTFWFTHRIPDTYIAFSQLVMDEEKPQNFMTMEATSNPRNLGYYRALFQSAAFQEKITNALEPKLQAVKIIESSRSYLENHLILSAGSIESFLAITAKTPFPELSYSLNRISTESLIVFCRRVANEETDKSIEAIKYQIEICVHKREEIQKEKS